MSRVAGPISRVRTVGLVAYALAFTGLFLILLSVIGAELWQWPIWTTAFIRDLGLLMAAVISGTILHEKLLRDEMFAAFAHELDRKLDARIPGPHEIATETAIEVHKQFCEHPPDMTGIRFLSDVRRNFSGYYTWVNEHRPQELFFAGRSVLHRIDADIRANAGAGAAAVGAEHMLFRRLKENSKIKIVFLDPRTNILERLAKEEGQTLQAMLGDIAASIGICHRLFELIEQNYSTLQPTAELTIRVYDRIPYFAYHKQDGAVIVGFYFLSTKGSSSAAYELVDDTTKQVFGDHFVRILSEAADSTLVEFDGARGRPRFNSELFALLKDSIAQRLTQDKTDELLNRK